MPDMNGFYAFSSEDDDLEKEFEMMENRPGCHGCSCFLYFSVIAFVIVLLLESKGEL